MHAPLVLQSFFLMPDPLIPYLYGPTPRWSFRLEPRPCIVHWFYKPLFPRLNIFMVHCSYNPGPRWYTALWSYDPLVLRLVGPTSRWSYARMNWDQYVRHSFSALVLTSPVHNSNKYRWKIVEYLSFKRYIFIVQKQNIFSAQIMLVMFSISRLFNVFFSKIHEELGGGVRPKNSRTVDIFIHTR